jgi:hypothetical protein
MAYIIALLIIVAANYAAVRYGSALTKRITLVVSATLPIILGVGVTLWFVYGYGLSATLHDPHFSIFWLIAGGATLATTATALLGQGLVPRRQKQDAR